VENHDLQQLMATGQLGEGVKGGQFLVRRGKNGLLFRNSSDVRITPNIIESFRVF
jgi:hypothetical protein